MEILFYNPIILILIILHNFYYLIYHLQTMTSQINQQIFRNDLNYLVGIFMIYFLFY